MLLARNGATGIAETRKPTDGPRLPAASFYLLSPPGLSWHTLPAALWHNLWQVFFELWPAREDRKTHCCSMCSSFLSLTSEKTLVSQITFFCLEASRFFQITYAWHWVKLVQLSNWCWIFLGRNFLKELKCDTVMCKHWKMTTFMLCLRCNLKLILFLTCIPLSILQKKSHFWH